MSKKGKFIKVKDSKTIELLKANGYVLLSMNDGVATFINNNKLSFSLPDKHIHFSDRLEF